MLILRVFVAMFSTCLKVCKTQSIKTYSIWQRWWLLTILYLVNEKVYILLIDRWIVIHKS